MPGRNASSSTRSAKQEAPRTHVCNRQRRCKIAPIGIAALCDGVMRVLEKPGHSLSVTFVSAGEIRKMNRRYRGKDRATDVLSFPYPGEYEEGRPILGEIVISPEVAEDNARRWHSSTSQEIRKLLVHGILHLLGYNHEADRGDMARLQGRLLRRLPALQGGSQAEARVK
jgi:probable rRNA maturation factor